MQEILLVVLKAVMDNTNLDDKLWDAVAEQVTEMLPGDAFEPLVGEVLVQIGQRLQKAG